MALDTRITELVAIGAAAAAHCVACLEHHVGVAREAGLPPEEVAAALEVGRMVRRGAGQALDRHAARLGVAAPGAAPAAAPARGCCG
jgi:AhpD family alkylhydroperoxidase